MTKTLTAPRTALKVTGLFMASVVAGTAVAVIIFGFGPLAGFAGAMGGCAFAGYILASLD